MSKSGSITGIAAFIFAVGFGLGIGSNSWNGKIFLPNDLTNNGRNPAAIKRELDFSHLDGAELLTATQKRLVSAAKVVLQDSEVGVELGHFVTRGEDGQRKLACDAYYNRLTLVFEADGIAEAGEKPMMEIDGPCRSSNNDITSIEPVWIPVEKIVNERPSNMDLTYDDGVNFRFDSMGTSWPLRWGLRSVRLYNTEEPDREVKITAQELREIRQKPLIVQWFPPSHPKKSAEF